MKEIKRLDVMHKIESKQLTGIQAAEQLRLSERQVWWLIASFRKEGALGLVHGNRGRAANNRIPEEIRGHVLELAEKEYREYNDSYFNLLMLIIIYVLEEAYLDKITESKVMGS